MRLLEEFHTFSTFWWTLGDDFRIVSVFSAELATWRLEEIHIFSTFWWLWETTSGLSPYSALSLGRHWIHVGFSLRGVWKNFTRFLRDRRRLPFRSAEADPHGPCFLADHRDFPVAVRYQVVDALVVHVVLDMPVVAQRQAGMVQTVQKTLWKYRRCSSCMVVDVPALVRGRPGGASDCSGVAGTPGA